MSNTEHDNLQECSTLLAEGWSPLDHIPQAGLVAACWFYFSGGDPHTFMLNGDLSFANCMAFIWASQNLGTSIAYMNIKP